MKRIKTSVLLAAVLATAAAGSLWAAGKQATVKGYVIDSACTFVKDLKKPVSPECAVACAKAGSPLVIQTANGVIYLPIAGNMPAGSQNEKLLPFAGQEVSVTGTVYVKGGARAIVIDKIEAAAK